MKKREENGSLLSEYDFSKGVRGKYSKQYHQGSNMVVLPPDDAKRVPNSDAVNQAFRSLARLQSRPRPGKRRQRASESRGDAVMKTTKRVYDTRRYGYPQIRVHHRKGRGKQSPRYLFKCGCCERALEVFYGGDSLEINGVHGAVRDWRTLLGPLLRGGGRAA